ncbi:MAG: GNAT family N-acetyltransferase [Cyanobacteria bacterium J06635_10]
MNNFNNKLALNPWFSLPSHHKPVAVAANPLTSQFQIRLCTAADLTGVAQIIAESFHSRHGIWGWTFPLLRLGIYEDLRHRFASPAPHHACLVAVDTKPESTPNLVATVELSVRLCDSWAYTNKRKSFAYLSNLAVHPQYRRQGAARGLLTSCEKVARDWGFKDLYLHVLENNYQARQLYFKLGYRMHQVESNWNTFFFRRSRQILLYKHLLDC